MDIQNKLVGNEGGSAGGGGGGGGDGGKKDDGPPKPLPCPRCNSNNTKFCYYNNYSLKQPRFFCKGCRRYWTQGGTLRNVPVGGGCRKSKRPKTGPPTSSASTQQQQQQQPPPGFEFTATTVGPSIAGLTGVAGTGGSSSNNNNNNTNFDNNMVFGGVRESSDAGFFLSSLNFGPNMGLLHGFGLPSFYPNSNPPFQNLMYSTRQIGNSSNSAPPVSGAWNLTTVPPTAPPPPPPLSEPNNIINSNNNGDNNNDNQTNQWADYMRNDDIEEP